MEPIVQVGTVYNKVAQSEYNIAERHKLTLLKRVLSNRYELVVNRRRICRSQY